MCKTYDCMGIGLAILVKKNIHRIHFSIIDCNTGALRELLLQLFLHLLLVL